MTVRMNRQIYGMLAKRLDEADLGSVPDGRGIHGRKWSLGSLLRAVVGGMVAGKQSLAEVEVMSASLTAPVRRMLGARRRVPDTTMRDTLLRVEPGDARRSLRSLVRAAQRRKALTTDGLPFGVVSFDGKHFDIPSVDDWYAQRQTASEGTPLVGMVRTVTVALTSSRARPIIEVVPIPAPTNEMGVFPAALDAYCAAYSGLELAKLVTYDAGACSAHNAAEVRARGLHYLFGLKGTQPTLYADAQRWLGSRSVVEANATTSDRERGLSVVRRLYLGEVTVVLDGWEHLRTTPRRHPHRCAPWDPGDAGPSASRAKLSKWTEPSSATKIATSSPACQLRGSAPSSGCSSSVGTGVSKPLAPRPHPRRYAPWDPEDAGPSSTSRSLRTPARGSRRIHEVLS